MDNATNAFILRWAKRYRAVKELGGKCINCGEDNIFKLDFHHRDPNEKDFGISQMSHHIRWEKLKKEIDKCDLLCRNCHNAYHLKETEDLFKKYYDDIVKKSNIVHEISKIKLDEIYIYDRLKDGFSLNEISRKLNKDVSTVRLVAVKLEKKYNDVLFKKIDEYNKDKTKISDEELLKLYNEGNSIKEIAKFYNMNKSTLFPRIKKLKNKSDAN